MWLRNCWYVIAWDHEVPAADSRALLRRVALNEPLLVYRTAAGDIVTLEDRCVHRHAPLSKGRREGDHIRCGYHGLLFDANGRCVEVPGLATVPPNLQGKACVRRYPTVTKNRWVFVWMGAPALADEALLPDNFSRDHPQWKHLPGYLHYDTPYLLICDNLLDFSHLSYVHESTLGGSPEIARTVPQIEPVPGPRADWPVLGIRVSRRVPNVPPPPFYQRFRKFENTNLNRWFIYDFLLPGTLLMSSGGRPVDDAEDDDRRAVRLHSCQTLTPETEASTHYFFQQSHPAGVGDEAAAESIYRSLVQAFDEDREMITAQHRNLAFDRQGVTQPMLPLAIDSALVQFRRALAERVEIERATLRA
jgi:vanillate O-demethylase monooxygenase subunit